MGLQYNASEFGQVEQATGVAGAAVTLTIAAVAGKRHAISAINIQRTSALGVTGNATLQITTTNLPDAMAWDVGNAVAAGGTQRDVSLTFDPPLMSNATGTATTIVMPAHGTDAIWTAQAIWFPVADV